MPIKHFEYFSSIGKPVVSPCSKGKMGLQQVWLSYNQLFNLFFFLFLCQLTCLHAQLCTQEQTSALLQFKQNISFNKSASQQCDDDFGITSFPKMESWKKGSNCCSWDGVECDRETGQVMGLDLSRSWLQGAIHPNSSLFLSFPHLQKLNLAHNDFSMSPVSLEFTQFTELKHLNLSCSAFSGNVPLEFSFLNKLVSLDLSFNYALRLEEGGFELLIQNLSKLRNLDLLIVNMSSSVVPKSLLNLTSLRALWLGGSGLQGEFPSGIFHLPHLQRLGIQYEEGLTGRIPDFINSTYPLQKLVLFSTGFSGILPDSIANLKSLQVLMVSECKFHGSIPTSLWNLAQITYLDLSSNNFSGQTLEFQSSSLEIIDLSYNDLHGAVPNSTFELRNLTHLILSSNSLSGTVPRSNRFSENLNVLALKNNNFSGTIHDSFTRRNSLTTINLYGNGFEGPIPKSLINCRNLKVLDLGRNNFFEEFPHWLGNLPNLHVLILQSNKFHGSIVTSTTKFPFPMLRVLDMSNNNFTGPLPIKYFKSFKAMMNVDEHFHLEYMEPSTMRTSYSLTMVIKGSTVEMEKILKVFTAIDLSRNKFQGEIPRIIGQLNSIRGLNLSHNSLTGQIPKSLGNLTKLEWLDLSSNKLTGEIPRLLTNLTFLGTLNLSQNRLTGPIPRGKQFDTFSNDSYVNNLALCGPPLSNTCGDPKATQPPPSTFEEEDSEPVSGFGWEFILPGYGFGLVVGLVMGYLMFSFGKPQWLVKMVEGVGNRKGKSLKSNARRRGGRRN